MTGQCSPLLSPLPCFDWDEDGHLEFNAVFWSMECNKISEELNFAFHKFGLKFRISRNVTEYLKTQDCPLQIKYELVFCSVDLIQIVLLNFLNKITDFHQYCVPYKLTKTANIKGEVTTISTDGKFGKLAQSNTSSFMLGEPSPFYLFPIS